MFSYTSTLDGQTRSFKIFEYVRRKKIGLVVLVKLLCRVLLWRSAMSSPGIFTAVVTHRILIIARIINRKIFVWAAGVCPRRDDANFLKTFSENARFLLNSSSFSLWFFFLAEVYINTSIYGFEIKWLNK